MQSNSKDATAPPQQIGPYQVVAKLGEGGMGVVYRARDVRLNRDVAVKVLPPALAGEPARMARFEREAQLLASLNHPCIAAIYGVEESGATRALVMELVEGPTLAERIGPSKPHPRPGTGSGAPAAPPSGAKSASAASAHRSWLGLPLDEALPIARQIAEALEYAHEHGVIHRDLKPANVKVTPDGAVKVLDFGLAKAMGPEEASSGISNSPTLSLAMTQAGFLLGTAAYMAPEQAKQKNVDRRADIWAFGCVLYEMLSGSMAFQGETVSDTLAEIIKGEPDWNALPPDTPPAIRAILRRCLVKDPRQRLRDIGDARIAIEETLSGAPSVPESPAPQLAVAAGPHPTPLRRALPWALGAAAVLLAALAAWLLLRPAPQPDVLRFSLSPPDNLSFDVGLSLSPDGHTLAFVAASPSDKGSTLWVRPLDSLTPRELPGTQGASLPFWSPDSRWIGFSANHTLEKIALSGGSPVALCDLRNLSLPNPDHYTTGTWNRDGVILFSNPGGIYQVSDAGGTPTLVIAADAARNRGLTLPAFLPDGRHFLVEVFTPGGRIAVGSLDSKSLVDLSPASSNALYAPPGYLFYLDQTTLTARPFDARALRFTGPAIPVAQNIGVMNGPDYGFFSVSPTGLLVYQSVPDTSVNQMVWFSRSGQNLGAVGQPDSYSNPALSLDGSRLAVAVGQHGKADIWIYDLRRGTASRLTFNPAYDVNPIWSSDGGRVFFTSDRRGPWDLYQKAADGLGSTQPVFLSAGQDKALNDISSDGRYAIYDTATSASTKQLWVVPLFGDHQPFPFVQGSFGASSAQFSPNGRYVAYTSNETGRNEIYVQTFPQHTGRWQVSAAGGAQPQWRHDGRELYFLSPDQKLMAVTVDTAAPVFQAAIPKELFQTQLIPISYWRNIYVPSPDGQRFLMIAPAGQAKPQPLTVVANWPSLVSKTN